MVDLVILFASSAFKHGVTEADIRWAFKTKKFDGILEDPGADGKYLLIGFDCNANLIELFYNVLLMSAHCIIFRDTYRGRRL